MKGILLLLVLSVLTACRQNSSPGEAPVSDGNADISLGSTNPYTRLRWTNDPSLSAPSEGGGVGAVQSGTAQGAETRDSNTILAEAVYAAVSLVTDGTTGIVTPDLLNTNVTVSVRDGVVTLDGLVNNSHEKWLLETRAQSVPGVASVVNRLQIGPVPAVVPDFEKVVQP